VSGTVLGLAPCPGRGKPQRSAASKGDMMKQVKLLRETYKTWDGAHKRCTFENALAKGEFERGDKAKFYCYTIVKEGETYRVARCLPDPK
jgi:hypothetical protein